MIPQSLHNHTVWDDGKNTAEEMVAAAYEAGFRSVGISLHAPMPFPADWTCTEDAIPAFCEEMARLKKAYAGKIRVYTGIEWDVLCRIDPACFDYAIGSVHHLPVRAVPPSVDECPEATEKFLREDFGGDSDAAAEMYFAEVEKAADEPEVQIAGHFDLVTKFDEKRGFFHPDSPRFCAAAEKAMQKLVAAGKIFEINTGAISRGWRTSPYPSETFLKLLREMGGRVTFGADAHSTQAVACAWEQAVRLAKACGFEEMWFLEGSAFEPWKL